MSDNLVEAQGYLESSRRETDPVAAMERLQQAVAWLISDGIDKERAEPVKVRVERPSLLKEGLPENQWWESLTYTDRLRIYSKEMVGSGVQPPIMENHTTVNLLDVEEYITPTTKPPLPSDPVTTELSPAELESRCVHKWFNAAKLVNPFLAQGVTPSHLEACMMECGAYKLGDKILAQVADQHS